MAQVLTAYQAYGVYRDEPLTDKVAMQFLRLQGTGANTDTDYDFGTYGGTFWTAVGGTPTGAGALLAIKDIQTCAQEYLNIIGGLGINGKAQIDSSRAAITPYASTAISGGSGLSRTLVVTGLLGTDTILAVTMKTKGANNGAAISTIDSTASSGGNPTETLAVTGLLTTDTILGSQVVTAGSNSVSVRTTAKTCAVNGQYVVTFSGDPGTGLQMRIIISRSTGNATGNITGWSGQADNALTVTFDQDPGNGTVVEVLVSRAAGTTTPDAGTYQIAMDGTNTKLPNLTFASGDAPTAWDIIIAWVLKDQEQPVRYSGSV